VSDVSGRRVCLRLLSVYSCTWSWAELTLCLLFVLSTGRANDSFFGLPGYTRERVATDGPSKLWATAGLRAFSGGLQ